MEVKKCIICGGGLVKLKKSLKGYMLECEYCGSTSLELKKIKEVVENWNNKEVGYVV